MNIQMMEGLMGASAGIRAAGAPMRVYRQACAEGDTEKMRRALGYTGECTERAAKYQEKLDKGMKAEAEVKREKAELEREAAAERRGEERRQAEKGTEPGCPRETDSVQISGTAGAALENRPAGPAETVDGDPVIYTGAGGVAAVALESEPEISLTV